MSNCTEQAWRWFDAGDADRAVRVLEGGCALDDGDALFTLGTWYLAGQGVARDRGEAAGLLRAATQAGNTDAARMEVALIGNGSFGPPDWPRALALLEDAAQTDPLARDQLDLVARMAIGLDGAPLAVPEGAPLSASPRAWLFPALVTPAECDHLKAAALPIMEPSLIIDPVTGQDKAHPIRTSDGTVLGPAREDLVVRAVAMRLAAASGTMVAQGETFSVLRYVPGQQYRLHVDTLPATDNQRIKTMILYLTDGYQGGETRFETGGLTIRGQKGDVLLFDNVLPDGRPDPASRHAGLPVTAGEKWVATRWIRQGPYDPWSYRPGA